jgi:hypothetical protein
MELANSKPQHRGNSKDHEAVTATQQLASPQWPRQDNGPGRELLKFKWTKQLV